MTYNKKQFYKQKAIEYAKLKNVDVSKAGYFEKQVEIKAKLEGDDNEDRLLGKTIIISGYLAVFGNVDRQNDVISIGAFKNALASQQIYPLLLDHCARTESLAGSFVGLEDMTGLYIQGKFLITEENCHQAQMILAGHLNRLSIGGVFVYEDMPRSDGAYIIKEVNLMEGSIVVIPANPFCIFSVDSLNEGEVEKSEKPTQVKEISTADKIKEANILLAKKKLKR